MIFFAIDISTTFRLAFSKGLDRLTMHSRGNLINKIIRYEIKPSWILENISNGSHIVK